MNCDICGSKMAHFVNPDRDICPNENENWHAEAAISKRTSDSRSETGRMGGEAKRDKHKE